MTTENVAELKAQGNKEFSAGNYESAIQFFSKAIDIDPQNQVLFSNRSASYAQLKRYQDALEDAEKAIKLQSSWGKAYGRKGAALVGLGKYDEAIEAYQEGLKNDPQNATLQKGIEEANQFKAQSSTQQSPFANMFGGDFMAKIAGNPETAKYLAQPDFIQMLQNVQRDPNSIANYLQDPRMMAVMGVMLGVNLQTANADTFSSQQESKAEETPKSEPSPSPQAKAKEPVKEPEPELSTEQSQALKLKDEGTALYKQKKFDQAIEKYQMASDLCPSDITFLNNIGAVYLEMGNYDECIKVCEKAVEVGRENRAEYKLIARSLGRIGTAYMKMEKYDEAIKYFEKSLTETRSADILDKLKQCEKLKKELEIAQYQDESKSEEARNQGNELFKAGKYADAVPFYSEAIKRSVKDAKAYSNRSAAYLKLMAFPEALKDADEAIKLDKNFVKAYVRKAAVLFAMKEYAKCMTLCDEAIEIDAQHNEGKSRQELEQQKQKCTMSMYGYGQEDENLSKEDRAKKAMNDPKVQEILGDPIMRQILDQMSTDPNAARDHMQNPAIREKIQYLAAAGVIGLR